MVRLSLCMITKDEEKHIARAISSAKDIVDEIIVVDTGSTDRTVEIAKSLGAQVETFTWCDDFSAAKNHALSFANGDWILSLDADEFLDEEGRKHIEDTLAKNVDEDIGGFMLEQRTYLPGSIEGATPNPLKDGPPIAEVDVGQYPYTISFLPVRLFRNGVQFTYRVHEQVEVDIRKKKLKMKQLNVVIHHLGSIKPDDFVRKKVDMYRSLLLQELEQSPDVARIQYLVGKMYKDDGNYKAALLHLEKAASLDATYKTPHREMGVIYIQIRQFPQAEAMFEKAVQARPDDIIAWNNLAVTKMHLKKLDEAEKILVEQLEKHPGHKGLQKNVDMIQKLKEQVKP